MTDPAALTDEELAERDLNSLLGQLEARGMFEARAIASRLIGALRPAGGPNAGASAWQSGAAIDGGERARRALNVPL